jgi:hypothetical protein
MSTQTKFEKHAIADITRVMQDLESAQVVQLLAKHMSTDAKLQQQIACHWMQPICMGTDNSLQNEIQRRFSSLLVEQVHLEVIATSHNDTTAVLYLFGDSLDVFGIPISLFRVNYIAFACILRLLGDGRENTKNLSFRSYTCSSTNNKSKWSQFSFNNTFQLHLNRSAFIGSILAYFAATSHRASLTAASFHSGNYREVMRVLLMSALSDSLSQIFGSGRSFSWLDDHATADLYRLLELCKTEKKFNARSFIVELAAQYLWYVQKEDENQPAKQTLRIVQVL